VDGKAFEVLLSDPNYGENNRKFIESKLNYYAGQISKANDEFADVFKMPKKKGDFKIAKENVLNHAREVYGKLGLNIKI